MESPSGEKTVRVFFALWPDSVERAVLAAWQLPLQQLCGGRIMRQHTLHATLVFLGDVSQHRLADLIRVVQNVNGASVELTFDRACYWIHQRIVYAAPAAVPQALVQIVAKLEQCLIKYDFDFDARVYRPHVTLLRHADQGNQLLPVMPHVVWRFRRFVLLQSLRSETGPYYRELAYFPLDAV